MRHESLTVVKSGFYLGGDSLADLTLAGILKDSGCHVRLIAGSMDAHAAARAAELKLPYSIEPGLDRRSGTYHPAVSSRLLGKVASSSAVLVSQAFLGQAAGFESYILDIASQVPTTFRMHDDLWPEHADKVRALAPIPGVKLCGTTEAVIDHVLGFGLEAESFVIPPLIDKERFNFGADKQQEARARVRSALGMSDKAIFILQATRVEPRKGIDYALCLAHALQMRFTDREVFLVVTGGGEPIPRAQDHKRELLAQAARLGFGRLVFLNGVKETPGYTVADYMYSCDLVSCPSTVEGFSMTIAEAFLCQKPVVARNFSSQTGYPIFKQVYGDFSVIIDSVENRSPGPEVVEEVYQALRAKGTNTGERENNKRLAEERLTQDLFRHQPHLLEKLRGSVA